MERATLDAKELLVSRTGDGNDFLGWIDLPVNYDKEEFARIKAAAKKIQEDSEVLVVIGIGGSYLGARAAIEFLGHTFYNTVDKSIRKTPEIYYAGNSISSTYLDPTHSNKRVLVDQIDSVVVNGDVLGGGYLDIGLIDTMEDLLVNFVGALSFSVLGFVYARHKDRRLIDNLVPTAMKRDKYKKKRKV